MHESMERLYEVMGTTSGKRIALELNVSQAAVTNWKKRGVSKDGALAAAELTGADANYILDGTPAKNPSINNLKGQIKSIESNKGLKSSNKTDNIEKTECTDLLPVISWVAAGSFCSVDAVTLDDIIHDAPKVPRNPNLSPKGFGLIVQGQSMSPDFLPGDVIYVDPEYTPWDLKDGDKVVVQCDNDSAATFKQIIIGDSPDDMYLKPLNPNWHEQKIIPVGECMLVGKVIGSYREC